jgi:hypothetical protein
VTRRFRHVVLTAAVLAFLASGIACTTKDPPALRDDDVTKTEKKKTKTKKDEPPPDEPGLRFVLDPSPELRVDGKVLVLGMKTTAMTDAIGEPTSSNDYGADEGAMSNTTYLTYAKHGFIVRTKRKRVEGFYVYLTKIELEGETFGPARLKLPAGLALDATAVKIESALGKPDEREVVASMSWLDLHYKRPGAIVKFHFADDEFRSVSLETPSLKSPLDDEE